MEKKNIIITSNRKKRKEKREYKKMQSYLKPI
jgi:hypothetical protein